MAECMQGPAFFVFIDILFKQQQWIAAGDIKPALFQLAQLAGCHKAYFDMCISDDTNLNQLLERLSMRAQPTTPRERQLWF